MRVMGQTVGQGLDGAFQSGDAPPGARQNIRPAGKAAGKFIRPRQFRTAQPDLLRRFAQGGDQGRLRPIRQGLRFHPQGAGDVQQQLATNPAAVVFNQVKIARRYSALAGKVRLLLTRHHPAFPDAAACQRITCHPALQMQN